MAKQTFVRSGDWSEYGESENGAIPCAVVLPDGQRISLANEDVLTAQWERGRSKSGYVKLMDSGEVRVRDESHGDDPARRHGRYRVVVEVIAPKESQFLFARPCPWVWGKGRGAESRRTAWLGKT